MTRLEAMVKIQENTKRKAFAYSTVDGTPIDSKMVAYFGVIVWERNGVANYHDTVRPMLCDDCDWHIKEPTLKEMSFGEAYRHYIINITNSDKLISVLTGLSFDRQIDEISVDEFNGLWTIEGVFEDE